MAAIPTPDFDVPYDAPMPVEFTNPRTRLIVSVGIQPGLDSRHCAYK